MSSTQEPDPPLRTIRSYVRRESRMTPAQERALREWWPVYGVDLDQKEIDLATMFSRRAPVVMEIGFGNGESLASIAAANPQNNYLGVEVHRPGVGHLLRGLSAQRLANIRVVCADANDVMARLPDGALEEVCLFFPDPWPKKRHHKRRLVQPVFVDIVRRKLRIGGLFRLATDWEEYAVQMLAVLTATSGFENANITGGYAARAQARPLTKFERRGQRLGHVVRDLAFARVS